MRLLILPLLCGGLCACVRPAASERRDPPTLRMEEPGLLSFDAAAYFILQTNGQVQVAGESATNGTSAAERMAKLEKGDLLVVQTAAGDGPPNLPDWMMRQVVQRGLTMLVGLEQKKSDLTAPADSGLKPDLVKQLFPDSQPTQRNLLLLPEVRVSLSIEGDRDQALEMRRVETRLPGFNLWLYHENSALDEDAQEGFKIIRSW